MPVGQKNLYPSPAEDRRKVAFPPFFGDTRLPPPQAGLGPPMPNKGSSRRVWNEM